MLSMSLAASGGTSLDTLLPLIRLLVASRYTALASFTATIWDIFLTFEDEVARVWQVKQTLGTLLFFLNRYVPPALFALDIYSQLAQPLTTTFCRRYQLTSTLFDMFTISIIECVLILRTNALYQSRKVLIFMGVLAVVSMSNMLAFFLILFHNESFSNPIQFQHFSTGCLVGCKAASCNYLFVAFWVPFFVLETVVFLLTACKSVQSLKEMRALGGASAILNVVIRDGIFYYIVIIAVSVGNLLVWHFNPRSPYLIVPVMKCLQVTICSRIMLNLRGLLESSRPSASQMSAGQAATLLDLDSFQLIPEEGDG